MVAGWMLVTELVRGLPATLILRLDVTKVHKSPMEASAVGPPPYSG